MILQQLKADYKRIFSSPKMYLSILGVVLLCYISTEKYIHGSVDIYYILDILIGLSVFKKLIIIFSALPCVTGFYDDWKHQYIKNIKKLAAQKAGKDTTEKEKKKLYYIQNRGVRINFFSGSFLGNFDFHRSINWYGIRL